MHIRKVIICLFTCFIFHAVHAGKIVHVGDIPIAPKAGNAIGPRDAAVDSKRGRIYTVSGVTANISVVHAEKRVVLATRKLEDIPWRLDVDVERNLLYVTAGANRVYVLKGSDLSIVKIIPVGQYPRGVAVNPYLNRVYTANSGDGTVSVIDGEYHEVIKTIPVGDHPEDVAAGGPTVIMTQHVYVTDGYGQDLYVIDALMNEVTATVKIGCPTMAVDVNKRTDRVYVTSSEPGPGTVFVIDGGSLAVVDSVPVHWLPESIDTDERTNRIYVANFDYYGFDPEKGYLFTVSIIDGATNTLIRDVFVGQYPTGVAVDSKNLYAYVTNERSNTLSVINGEELKWEDDILLGAELGLLDANPDRGKAYVCANTYLSKVFVIDGALLEVTDTIDVTHPAGIAVNSKTNKIFVGNAGISKVTVIDGRTNRVITRTDLAERPADICVDEKLNTVYIGMLGWGADLISLMSGETFKIERTEAVEPSLKALASNEPKALVHAVFSSHRLLNAYDAKTLNKLWSVQNLGDFPTDLGLNPRTQTFYVPLHFEDSLWIKTPLMEKVIPVGDAPWAVSLDGKRNLVFVSNTGGASVSVVDGRSNEVVDTIRIEGSPGYTAVDEKAAYLYLCNTTTGFVEVYRHSE
jgi:YVTN family beta-propeller protein